MPRIPFTDLASSPEFKALPPEDQQVVATGYWDEVAAERPDQAEFYKGIRDVSKSLLDAKTERADASPVQRRFLDARVQDLAFDLSLGDEFAQGRLTQEGYTEALKVRNTESAQRQAPLDKTRDLFSDDPAKQKALAIRLDGLEQTATTGGIFGKMPFNEILFNTGVASRDAYAALKEQTAKDYGMEPDEVEDLVKHRLGFQEKPVSRDAVGNPFIKPEIIAQGPDAVKQAILNSDLPWREKQRMTAEGDLKERMDGYYKSTMEGVKKNHSELYKLYKLDLVQDDPKSGFSALTSSLNQDFGDKLASGFTGYTFGVAEQVAPAAAYLDPNVRIQAAAEGRDSEQAAQEARGKSQRVTGFARRAQESVNQLSKEFYKNQGTLWGVDASAYGSGAGSVLTAVGLGMATGGLALPVTSARVATMGPSALRMLNGANSVMRASPSIGLAMAQTGTSTYENALKSGKSEEEAGKLATLAGAGEGVFTGLFSLLGVGGLESVGEQLIGTAARQAVRDTAKSGFRTFGEKMLKGVTAEQFEEGLIAAFDSATVQARINPNMTVEDFQNTLRETALVTLAVSGPTIGMGALKQTLVEKATYQQTDDEVELRADLNLADATDPLRDRVRREGGVGTPLGERLRLTRPSARGTVPLEGAIPSDVVTDVNGVPVIPDDATNRIDTTATQPGQANMPPAGQGPANAPPDSGVAAPGAPAPVAPGGTQPVAPAQGPTGAPAAVPGVQPVGAAQPVLVRSNAEVDREMARRNLLPPNPMLTPEERQADLQNRAPDLAAPAAPAAPGLSPQAIAAGAVPAPTRSPAAPAVGDSPTPTPVNRAPKDQSEQELYDDWVTTGPYGGPEMVTVYRVAPVGADPTIRAGTWVSANTDYLEDYAGADWRSQPHEILEVPAAHLRDAETGGGPGDTLIYTPPIPTPTTDETKVEEASGLPPVEGQPVVPSPAVQAQEGTAQREGQGPQEVADVVFTPKENGTYDGAGGNYFSDRSGFETSITTGVPPNDEGWKPHVSATPENASKVLAVVLPILNRLGIPHKFVSPENFATKKPTSNIYDKLVTTYPIDAEEAAAVMKELDAALSKAGLTDARWKAAPENRWGESGMLSYRYGGVSKNTITVEGKEVADDRGNPNQVEDSLLPLLSGETPAVEEAPAETLREPEPTNWSEVFEVLNDRDPDTKPINTESSKFRELVNSLKDTRVGELAGRLFQKKADVAKMRAEVKAAREAREKEFRKEQKAIKERRKAEQAEKPLDKYRKRIVEMTKDEEFPQGRNPNYQKGLRQWLRARGYNASIKKKGFLDGLLGYVTPLRVAKRERLQNLYASLTPEVKEMLDLIYRKPEKIAEEIPIFAKFRETEIGEKLLDAPIRSISSFRDAGEKMPVDYEGLVENNIKAHVQSRVFTRDPDAPTIEDLLESLNTKYADGVTTGSMYSTGIYSAEDIVKAINDLSEGNVKSQEDYDAYYEKQFQEDEKNRQEAEDREIAFAEQQIKALENKVQTVDLRQVRDGDKFTLGGTEYTATGVEADKRGQTESFTLFAFNPETDERGPLSGTRVSDDFFAESVTPTKGSLAHVDPAEIEAINIAQAFPEEFEDAAEPAPTATEPEVAPTAGPVPYSPEALKETFDVSDEQAVAMDALVQAMGLDTSRIQLQRGGVPSDAAMRQDDYSPKTPEETKAAEKASSNKVTPRSPELAVAAVRLANGEITSGDYADLVDRVDPFEVKGGESIPSGDKIKTYIASDKREKVNAPIPAGKEVEFRIDIPTYNKSTAAGDTVYAVTAHEPVSDTATRVGAPISYVGVARVTNPRMMTRAISGKGQAIEIAEGSGKFPLATVKGNNAPITELPADIGDPNVWTEVAYNPIRSSFFVDVRSKQAVVGGSEAIMVGSRVFVRNPTLQPRPRGFQTGPDILYQETSSTKWDREKFDSLPDQSKKNLAINIVEYGWNPAEFGMTDADVQTWAAEGLAKRAARLAEETAAEARSRAVLEKSKTAPPEASLVTEADLQESQLPDDGYFYHVTTPTGARAILKSRRIASGKRQSMADGYYAEYSRGKVFFTDRGGVSYWQGKISDHLEAQGRSGKTVTIRIPKHAVGDLKVDEPGTRDARTPAWFSPENVLFQNQQGPAKGSFEQLPETGDILLRGLSSPDVSTGVHEIAHAARRTILNRDTPAEARAGITDADIAVAEEWAGAKDGVWTRAAEEKFARGWERYLRDGKSPVAALQGVFDKMAAWLRSVYVTVAGSPIDVEISPEMRAVFDKLVSRTLPQAATPAPQPQATTPQPQATTPPPPAEPTPAPVAELEDPDVVGMQNAATDRRRQRAGLPPRFAPVRLTNQAAWDEAMRRINRDPAAGRNLVNDLRKSPRSLDPVETALYTHELLVRTQRTDDAYAAYNKDQNDQTEKDMREAAAAEAEAILTAERIGTIEGRALQARKILVHQDFSLGRLVAKATAANGGKEPNADQMKEIAELHKKLQDVQTQLAVAQEQIAKEEAQRVHVTVVADYKKGLREAKSRGEKGPGFIDRKAEEARARILARKREGRLNSLPVDELLDHAIVGVSYLKNGLVSIGEFTTQLVKDFGRKVLPFANDIFAKSQELYGATSPSSKVKSRENVLDDIDSDAPLNDKAIFQLVRHYINEGVDGFEPVMQAVLTDLRQFYPDLTLREVHDAYSKYGQTSVPSKEPDLKLAREYRELSRLQSQLEDAERSLVPLKTGLQREKATQRVRDLTKQVKDTMRRLNIQPTTNENQLRSAFDAIKTRLRNEYEDLDTAIRKGVERKERSPQTFTPEQEKELKDLRQRRDDRKADYEAIFKKKGLTDAERIDRAERLLDRRIAEERDMLEKGILKRNREMLMGPFSPALKSRRETLDKLKAERRELQKAARPKTPELEKKYQRDLKSLEKRIKEEEDLLAAGLTARQKDIKMGKWTPEMAEMQARLDGLRDARRELAESRKPEKDEAAAAYERATKAIEASIQRYKDIIAGIAKPDAGKKYSVDAEMAALLDQRDALRDAAAALRAMDPARIDKRKQAVLKALDKSIIEISRKITDGDLSTKGRKPGEFDTDPDVTKLRDARDLLNKTLETMRKDALPKRTPEEIRNSRDRKLIENKIDKLRDRLARGDYAPKPKLPPPDYAGRDALIKEKKRLESEFNMKVLELALASRSLGRKIFDNTLDVVFGVSRAMLTSFDAGAFGRQAGLVNFMRPGLAIKNFPANFAFSEKAATRYETAMEADPRWARAQAADLALTSWRPGSSLTDMEEVYRSRIAKKIPGVAASERAYVTYLNQVRFTYFNALMDTLPVAHQTEENMKFLARHVNMMTGRGKLGPKMEGAAAALASVFFSPKYWWSRLQVLGNMIYIPLDAMTGFRLGAKETKIARQIVAVEYARLGAMLGLVFGLIAFAKDAFDWEEFSIGTDWRSSDFGKLRLGNTRIDFMAGLLQNVVFIGRMVTGEKTTGSGERVPISGNIERKFGQNRLTETIRLLRTKLSPAAGSIVNFLDEQDVVGNKFNLETEILGSYIPMSAAETYSSMRELGIGAGPAAGLLNFIGIGAATYGGKEDFVIEEDIFTGRIMEPFGIKPGTFFIDQSRYEKEVKEKGWKIPKSKGLPTF